MATLQQLGNAIGELGRARQALSTAKADMQWAKGEARYALRHCTVPTDAMSDEEFEKVAEAFRTVGRAK